MTAMWLMFSGLLVDGDYAPAHYGTGRAPKRVLLHHYHFKNIKWLSLSRDLTSLYQVYSVVRSKTKL